MFIMLNDINAQDWLRGEMFALGINEEPADGILVILA